MILVSITALNWNNLEYNHEQKIKSKICKINKPIKWLTRTKKVYIPISLSSLLWRSTQLYLGEGSQKNRGHYYSSLQLTYTFHYYSSLQLTCTFKTRTKHTKTHTAAFISAAVLSAATKLRRLALCAFIFLNLGFILIKQINTVHARKKRITY